jgi:hypothetical protein
MCAARYSAASIHSRSFRVYLIWSAHDRSAVRASTARSVRATCAVDGSSVVGVFANNRRPIGSSTAGSIYTIGANGGIGLMGYSEPAKHDDYGEREFPHDRLPVESLTMLPVIEGEQPRPYRDESRALEWELREMVENDRYKPSPLVRTLLELSSFTRPSTTGRNSGKSSR